MKTKKRWTSLICAGAMLFTLAACSGEDEAETYEDYADSTIVGQITEIDGDSVTLELGELTQAESLGDMGEMPDGIGDGEMPDGIGDGEMPDGEAPDGMGGEDGFEDIAEDEDTSADSTAAAASGGSAQLLSASGDLLEGDDEEETDGTDAGQADGEVPELPDGEADGMGEAPDGTGDMGGEAPDIGGEMNADGEMPEDMDGEMPDAAGMGGSSFTSSGETLTLDFSTVAVSEELAVGDILQITFDSNGAISQVETLDLTAAAQEGFSDGTQTSSEVDQGSSANTIDADGDYADETYTSTGDDENALRVDGATVTLDGISVDKSGGASSDTESGDFYGINAALLATNGAQVTITNATITSSAQNGNGVFSYGDGTVVTISDSTITTTADNSGGIQTTGGGTTYASNLTVTTAGSSSAAIRSDRGGGTVVVDGGTYTSNGYNSPAVYSTADITVSNATLTVNNSEALVIEGENSITLTDCDVTGNMSDTEGTSSDENVHNVMIYQSMSGDAEVGTSTFSMTGGSLTSLNGDLIYVTNTHCVLTLSGVDIDNQDEDGYFLVVSGNSGTRGWGSAGSNGAQVEFTADGQSFEGDIIVDTISTLTTTLTGGSDFTGTVNIVDNEEGGEAVSDNAVVVIESGSTWTLTGDCTLTSLTNEGTINYNGYTITLADGTVLSE
ncbi:MAG: hypothetical protein LUD69_07635 [Oscillospiraceae bacterium]|nr:hypothetical protein [Oscillospiraceae bacterium]